MGKETVFNNEIIDLNSLKDKLKLNMSKLYKVFYNPEKLRMLRTGAEDRPENISLDDNKLHEGKVLSGAEWMKTHWGFVVNAKPGEKAQIVLKEYHHISLIDQKPNKEIKLELSVKKEENNRANNFANNAPTYSVNSKYKDMVSWQSEVQSLRLRGGHAFNYVRVFIDLNYTADVEKIGIGQIISFKDNDKGDRVKGIFVQQKTTVQNYVGQQHQHTVTFASSKPSAEYVSQPKQTTKIVATQIQNPHLVRMPSEAFRRGLPKIGNGKYTVPASLPIPVFNHGFSSEQWSNTVMEVANPDNSLGTSPDRTVRFIVPDTRGGMLVMDAFIK